MNLGSKIKLIFRNTFIHNNYVIFSRRLKAAGVVSPSTGQSMVISAQRFNEHKAVLQSFGFNDSQAYSVLNKEPSILTMSKGELSTAFANYYRFKISEHNLLKTVTSCPKLLLLDAESLQARIKELMTLFTQKDILKLLKTCPEVYYVDFDVITEKVQYFVHFMGAEQHSIIKSGALKLDLDEIRLRHNFLLYAGKFKKPKAKLQFQNPPLNKVLHNNLNTYLKLSGLTLEEYDVYESMFDKLLDFEKEIDEEDEEEND